MLAVVFPLAALVLVGRRLPRRPLRLLAAFERQRVRDLSPASSPKRSSTRSSREPTTTSGSAACARGDRPLLRPARLHHVRRALPADEVIDVLNRYLGEMSDAILDHGGTLVSYIGDGIMAVFGAPIEQPDHADRALAAAREMLDVRLPRVQRVARRAGHGDGFRMGIGLNSGRVMSGNVGSERRLEYTAIGDTTNTASRLEGMTKGTPHPLFIADSTRELLTGRRRARLRRRARGARQAGARANVVLPEA